MNISASIRQYRKYCKDYAFFAYRPHYGKPIVVMAAIKSILRLIIVLLYESVTYYKRIKSCEASTIVFIGSRNNYSAYLSVAPYLGPHEVCGFHTFRCQKQVSFLWGYCTGMSSIFAALLYSYDAKRKLRNTIIRNLDRFVLANGESPHIPLQGVRNAVIFSEYTVYINKIIDRLLGSKVNIIYFQHAALPKYHPVFRSSSIFLESFSGVNNYRKQPDANFIELGSLRLRLLAKQGTIEYHSPFRILICFNKLDSIKIQLDIVRSVRKCIPDCGILIRFHPAQSMKWLRLLLLRVAGNFSIRSGDGELLSIWPLVNVVICGLSGIAFEAAAIGKLVVMSHMNDRTDDYYGVRFSDISITLSDFLKIGSENGAIMRDYGLIKRTIIKSFPAADVSTVRSLISAEIR